MQASYIHIMDQVPDDSRSEHRFPRQTPLYQFQYQIEFKRQEMETK